jgi:hypothetical protein
MYVYKCMYVCIGRERNMEAFLLGLLLVLVVDNHLNGTPDGDRPTDTTTPKQTIDIHTTSTDQTPDTHNRRRARGLLRPKVE